MPALVAAILVALAAAPTVARGAPGLRLSSFEDARAGGPSARVEVPVLDLGGAAAPLRLDGAGARAAGDATPALSLILGIIPGFGLGHLIAGSPRWTTWLIVDVVLLAIWVIGSEVEPLNESPLDTLFFVAIVVERVFEGIDAFQAAGGRLAAVSPRDAPAWAFARPLRDPAAALGRF
jgi:hypothetical protein